MRIIQSYLNITGICAEDSAALTDHLGSAQVTAAEGGAASGVQRYSAFGEVRSRGIGTILHETAHVFDFHGDVYKSDMFVSFFSPGVYCQSTLLGCLNSKADISFKQVTLFYASVNLILSGTSNFGYNPTQSGTTFYGAVGNRDDWAETYAVMVLENAGYSLEQDQANVWEERKMIIKLWLNK